MNWQLGSRAQWLNENIIIFNDIDGVFNARLNMIFPQIVDWSNIKDHFGIFLLTKNLASLNFSRIRKMRPGYGYKGKNIDNFEEVLTIFSLENDSLIYSISLDEILQKVKFDKNIDDEIYLNHIVWSPSSKKLITIFNF